MAGFSELIKSFDKTRDYVRDFFIYGCKVRSEFDKKSARTYDNEKRRVESWLADCLRSRTTERGKQVSISVNSGTITGNPLFRALESRSFTANDIRLHFLLLDLLADGEAHSIRALTEALVTEYDACFDEQTVRAKLREYAAEGILDAGRQGNAVTYRLRPETPAGLFEQCPGLADAVRFFAGVPEFGFVGHTLLQSAGLRNTEFLMKHRYIVHVLEDEVLLQLLDYMENGHAVGLSYCGRSGAPTTVEGVPLRIHCSTQTGRRYLVLYHPALRRFHSYRLDCIRSVKDAGVCEDYDAHRAALARNAARCFGVSFRKHQPSGREYRVRVIMRVDMEREPYILDRLQREKRCGSVTRLDRTRFAFEITVFDPNELMGWLKTYIGRIESIEGAPEEFSRFCDDIRRMQAMYAPAGPEGGARA